MGEKQVSLKLRKEGPLNTAIWHIMYLPVQQFRLFVKQRKCGVVTTRN